MHALGSGIGRGWRVYAGRPGRSLPLHRGNPIADGSPFWLPCELQVDPQGGLEGLPAYANPNSVESEAFRTLRTGLGPSGS